MYTLHQPTTNSVRSCVSSKDILYVPDTWLDSVPRFILFLFIYFKYMVIWLHG